MYKLKIVNGIATGKFLGCWLNEGEVEVTSAQFLAAELPCRVTVTGEVVTLGDRVNFNQMSQTVGVAPVATEAEVRTKRDSLLSETDYTQMWDSPLTEESKTAFCLYRQGLRDVTIQAGFPTQVMWPEMPEAVKK